MNTATATDTTPPALTIDLDDHIRDPYKRVDIYLVPGETVRIYDSVDTGSQTMDQWHTRHLYLASVPTETCADSLTAWLERREPELLAIAALHLGDEWSGNNIVGRWAEETEEVVDALDTALYHAITEQVIDSYWAADDWLGQTPENDLLKEISDAGSARAAAEAMVENAITDGVRLDVDDIEEHLQNLVDVVIGDD